MEELRRFASVLVVATLLVGTTATPSAAAEPTPRYTGLSVGGDVFARTWLGSESQFQAPRNVTQPNEPATLNRLWIEQSTGQPYNYFVVGAPTGEDLQVGAYEGATSVGYQSNPYISIPPGNGTGRFEILELEGDASQITSLAIHFEMSVDSGGTTPRWGDYRFNSTIGFTGPELQPLSSGGATEVLFGTVPGGSGSEPRTLALANKGSLPVTVSTVALAGQTPSSFEIVADGCSGRSMDSGSSCTVDVRATPPAAGGWSGATLVFAGPGNLPTFGAWLTVVGSTTAAITLTTPETVEAAVRTHLRGNLSPMYPNLSVGTVWCYLDGEAIGGSPVAYDSGAFDCTGAIPVGDHVVKAVFIGSDWHQPPATQVETSKPIKGLVPVAIHVAGTHGNNVPEDTAVAFTVTMTSAQVPDFGTLSLRNAATDTVIASEPVTGTTTSMTTAAIVLPPGANDLVAEFVGDPNFVQKRVTYVQTVREDTTVAADGLSTSPTTFYPVVDGYRDLLRMAGTTYEPTTVTIRVYKSSGSLVRTLSLRIQDGPYATTWNGKGTSGTLLPAGSYKVRHELRDSKGNVLTKDTTVTLSWRKVKWLTTSITKYGASYSMSWKGGSGSISKAGSSFARGVRVSGGSRSGYAVTRWTFRLRTALAYKRVRIEVLGKGTRSTSRAILAFGQASMGIRVGPAYGWYGKTDTGRFVDDGVVWLDVEADGPMSGAFDVAKTRVTYVYAVWR